MSVTVVTRLPAQPASGAVVPINLGGDGLISPRFAFQFRIAATGDATGGVITISAEFPEDFTSVLSFAGLNYTETATQPARWLFGLGPDVADNVVSAITMQAAIGLSINSTFIPPPAAAQYSDGIPQGAPRIQVSVANVNLAVATMKGLVYCFDRDAVQKVPLERLFQVLSRGTSSLN